MIPMPYLYAGIFLTGMAIGGYATHTWYQAQRVDEIEDARKDERSLQKGANQAGVRYADAIFEQERTATLNETKFMRVLNEKNSELADCRVDADVLRVLDEARVSGAAGHPAEPGPRPDRTAPAQDSSCAVELDKCRANYAEVCVPNAIHVRELRRFTRDLIDNYNRSIGR